MSKLVLFVSLFLTAATAMAARSKKIQVRRHAGYDHSYFFIETFINNHLKFHASHLN